MGRLVRKVLRNRRGSLMTDIGVGLLVFGMFVGAVWAGVPLLKEAFRQSRWDQQLLQIVQQIRRSYYGQTTMGTGDITAALVTSGAFPGDMAGVNGCTVGNPFGGCVTVTGNGGTFYLLTDTLSPKSCIENATANTNVATDIGLLAVRINSTDLTTFPVTPATAESNCSGTTNTVRYQFRMRD